MYIDRLQITNVETLKSKKYFYPGKRRYDKKQQGFGGQTKPIFHKKVCVIEYLILVTVWYEHIVYCVIISRIMPRISLVGQHLQS